MKPDTDLSTLSRKITLPIMAEHMQIKKQLLLFLPLIIYILALNPYIAPNTYDNIIYLEGAKSLVLEGKYAYQGKYIIDWPPLMSLLLSIPFFFGLYSVFLSKILVLICVAIGVWFSFKVLYQEEYKYPLLSCFMFVLSPTAFLWGTRIMTEWPYIAFSMIFLFLLGKMEKNRSTYLAVMAGLLFAICLLTRYVGISLIAAPITMIIHRILIIKKQGFSLKLKEVLPELLAIGIGLFLFSLIWLGPIAYLQLQGLASPRYYHVSTFFSFKPIDSINAIADVLIKTTRLPLPYLLEVFLATIVFLVTIIGLGNRIISKGIKKTDSYLILNLFILTTSGNYTRYLLPIAPFLFSHFFFGINFIIDKFKVLPNRRLIKGTLIGLFTFFFLVCNAVLLFYGNKTDYKGLSMIVSPTPEHFYRNEWLDLYRTGIALKNDPSPGKVGTIGIDSPTYIHYFSNRYVDNLDDPIPHLNPTFLVIKEGSIDQKNRNFQQDWSLLKKINQISVYKSNYE